MAPVSAEEISAHKNVPVVMTVISSNSKNYGSAVATPPKDLTNPICANPIYKTKSPLTGNSSQIFSPAEGATTGTEGRVNANLLGDGKSISDEGGVSTPDLVTAIPNTSSQLDPKAQASKSSTNPSADLAQETIISLANQISANILKYSPVDLSSNPDKAVISGSDVSGAPQPLVYGGGPPENSAPVIPSFNSSAPSDPVGVGADPILKDGSSSSAKGATSVHTMMAGNDLSAAALGAKSFSAIIAGVPVSEKKLGTVDLTTSNPTVIFTKDECDQVSSFYRFAIIAFCDKLRMRREISFNGFPMRVFRWDPFFNYKEEPAIVPLWVKIHALPPQWFDLRSLETIASSVGDFLKAYDLTYNRSRLSFARVCVEVNLKNLLPDKINLQVDDINMELDIEFEKKGKTSAVSPVKINAPPPEKESDMISNPFQILSTVDFEPKDSNLEGSNQESCLVDKDPVLPNNNWNPTAPVTIDVSTNDHLVYNLVDIVIIEEEKDFDELFFRKESNSTPAPVSKKTNNEAVVLRDLKNKNEGDLSDSSADFLQTSENYQSDFSVSSSHSGHHRSLSDQSDSPPVGTEIIPFIDKGKNVMPPNKKGGKKKPRNPHQTSNILDKRTRSGAVHND
ncbi:hypothetical protein OROMI_020866 [Orobanche minor]